MRAYLKESAHPVYGAWVALVMFMAYEILLVADPRAMGGVRNAPEAWTRTLLYYLGVEPRYLTFVMITGALLAIPWFHRHRTNRPSTRVFGGLVVEAMIWGAVSGIWIQWVLGTLFFAIGPRGTPLLTKLGLAVGAGLFEELFFRVFLTSLLIMLFTMIFKSRLPSLVAAVLLASFLFSLMHYVGSLGDSFELYSFVFRFFAGLWFTTLYAVRGFALTALTHAFYDIYLVLGSG